jgi:hypothetical protein
MKWVARTDIASVAQDCSNVVIEAPAVLLLTSGAERLFGSQRSEPPTLDRLPRSGLFGETLGLLNNPHVTYIVSVRYTDFGSNLVLGVEIRPFQAWKVLDA